MNPPVAVVILFHVVGTALGVTYNLIKGDACSSCCRGLPGPQGVPGLPGLHGARGGQGPTGLKGPKGDMGLAGKEGEAGIPGEMGVKGRRGRKGAKGDCGSAGPIGPPGQEGVSGEEGARGPKGDKGDKGPHPARVAFTVSRSEPLGPVVQKTPVIFDTIHTNLGDSFDVYSSHFVCKVNGTYIFIVHALSAENQTAYGWIMLNNDHQLAFHGDAQARHGTGSNTLILRLKRDDHVWVQLNEKSSLLNHFSSFSGHILFED
ncbi:caprin-2-like [Babylonia areolata]|uniref:caprin-2-like n=1 Tax=Babylonia areolata TaxID=304850 RepID=UPI003FD1DD42